MGYSGCSEWICVLVKKVYKRLIWEKEQLKDLTKVLSGNYCRIYCDNYFSGVKLLRIYIKIRYTLVEHYDQTELGIP